jgi:hypothetical protein
MTETAKDAARRLAEPAIRQGFQPERLHEYRDSQGRPLYWRIRAKHANGEKWIRPMKLNGHGYELGEPAFPNGKPLYNLDLIARQPTATVYAVEGEKAADALTEAGVVATTSGGAQSAEAADWSPLAGRTVVVWRDNDDPGKGYAGEVANRLLGLGCEVSAVNVDRLGLAPKADAYDWLEGRTAPLSDLETLPLLRAAQAEQNTAEADLTRRFRAVTMLELVNASLPEPEPLLLPWLRSQRLAQVHAWRGIGKTHFSLGVAYAIATGGTYLRWSAPRANRVLFLDGEMPAVALQERVKAILEADDRDVDIDEDMLRFITPDLLEGAPPDLANREDQERLGEVIAALDPRLIVVDNISTLVRSGGAENDAEAWIPVQSWALQMRREGRAVLFVHHTGKGGKQRGTSKREDVLDAVISLRRPEPYDPAEGARFIVEFEKARHLRGDDAKAFEAKLGTDAQGRQCWTTLDIERSTVDRVVALYRDGITRVHELADELECNKSTASRALRKAKEMGLISDKEAA